MHGYWVRRVRPYLLFATERLIIFQTLVLVMGFSSLLVFPTTIHADDSLDTLTQEEKDRLEDRQDELDDIKAKIKAYKNIVNLKQRQGSALSDQIESLEAQASGLELQISLNRKTLTEIQGDVQTLSERIHQKETFIEKQRHILAEIMRGYYADQANLIPAALLVNASQLRNPLQQDEWSTQTSSKMNDVLSTLKALHQSLLAERQILLEKQKTVDTLRLQLEEQDARLASTKLSKEQLLKKTQSEVIKYDSLVDDLEKQRDEIENEIQSLESGKIDDLNMKDIPAFSRGLLEYPVRKVTVTQSYGKTSFAKTSKFYGKAAFHNGVDFGIASGSAVMAAADGKVIAIGNNGRYAYGRYIAIDHGNGLTTMYGHLSSVTQKLGDKVLQGETIAKSGNTGNSTGPHVHFTVFSTKSFDTVPSKYVSSVKDIPIGATVNPKFYLP